MRAPLTARLVRLGRWPRRVAAIACLVMAGVTALSAPHPKAALRQPDEAARLAAGLQTGEVAVPVTLVPAARRIAQAGDRVDLFATPSDGAGPAAAQGPIGTRLLVLSVSTGEPAGALNEATMIVASDRATALRIAAQAGRPVLAVLDK